MLLAIEEPLMSPIGIERAQTGRQIAFNEGCLVQPGRQNPVQNDQSDVRLINANRLEVRLMVEPAAGVVVTARIPRCDVIRRPRGGQRANN